MQTLPAGFLQKLVDRLDDENTLGITLSGSFARREAGACSDVDLWQYVRQEPPGDFEMPRLEFVDGYLVSVKATLIEKDYAGLRNPQQAIWVVPALRQAQILFDRDGAVSALVEAARNITWESLQTAADAFASRDLASTAEEVYKILDGLAQENESKIIYAIWSLTRNLADALLVQRGVLIPTENVFLDYAQATAGRSSSWTRQFRQALGLDSLPSGNPAFISLGIAGLRLYRQTVLLLQKVLLPEDARIVERMLDVMTEAGY